jgi:hypothetical protein
MSANDSATPSPLTSQASDKLDSFSFDLPPCPDTVSNDIQEQFKSLPKVLTHEPSANDDNTVHKDIDRSSPMLA